MDTDIIIERDSEDFEETGLTRTSCIKLHRLVAIELDGIKAKLGVLPKKYHIEVKEKLRLLLEN
ncbi:MAG: hypothetical protein M3P33_00450 [bacterium]|nr:hypothetical protein [bacterium]